MPSEYTIILSARQMGRRSPLKVRKAERRPVIELEAPVSQTQSSARYDGPVKKRVATLEDLSDMATGAVATLAFAGFAGFGAEVAAGGLAGADWDLPPRREQVLE